MMILTAVIAEYKVEKVDDKVMKRMKLALQLPFTDTDAEAAALEKALLGYWLASAVLQWVGPALHSCWPPGQVSG
jgi:hypothetical protein